MKKSELVTVLIGFFLLGHGLFGQGPVKTEDRLNSQILGPKTEPIDLSAYKNVYYISATTGSDKNGEGTAAKPWQTINHALTQTQGITSENRSALLAAGGTYAGKTVKMCPHVDMYGGFEPQFWQRDIFKYKTILDGQGVRRVIIGADSVRLDGFVVTGGMSSSHGGGILCDDSSPEISNNIIRNNTVLGPAVFNTERIHQAGNQGGGLACMFNAVPLIRNNLIYQNRTAIGNGAGLAFYGWVRLPGMPDNITADNRLEGGLRSKVVNNVIMYNQAGIDDLFRTRSSNGGGISVGFEARPVIKNNLIAMNDAGGRGDAGGIYIEYFADPDIIGNWIIGNTSDDDGGGLYTMRLGQPLIAGNIFAGNYTRSGGAGAIRLSKEGRATIKSNLIVENSGGGVTCVDSYMELHNNIITRNTGRPGVIVSNKFTYFKPSSIIDNIIAGNRAGNIDISGTADVIQQDNQEDSKQLTPVIYQPVEIINSAFDEQIYVTHITIDQADIQINIPEGAVIHIGERWSLVKAVAENGLVIWGNGTLNDHNEKKVEFLPGYRNK